VSEANPLDLDCAGIGDTLRRYRDRIVTSHGNMASATLPEPLAQELRAANAAVVRDALSNCKVSGGTARVVVRYAAGVDPVEYLVIGKPEGYRAFWKNPQVKGELHLTVPRHPKLRRGLGRIPLLGHNLNAQPHVTVTGSPANALALLRKRLGELGLVLDAAVSGR
jgi:hypothetical protein